MKSAIIYTFITLICIVNKSFATDKNLKEPNNQEEVLNSGSVVTKLNQEFYTNKKPENLSPLDNYSNKKNTNNKDFHIKIKNNQLKNNLTNCYLNHIASQNFEASRDAGTNIHVQNEKKFFKKMTKSQTALIQGLNNKKAARGMEFNQRIITFPPSSQRFP